MKGKSHKLLPDIGLCMIAKDSESVVDSALRSAARICRDLVLVDTGSKDATPSIASRFGADVYFYEWNNDFSAARNYGLSLIRNEWILVLDSDEVIDYDSFVRYFYVFDDITIGGINLIIENALNDNSYNASVKHRYTRIFRNDRRIRFQGKIHEQVRDSIEESGYKIFESDIRIFHSGYSEISEQKLERNISMLRQEVSTNPGDPWYKYHLAESEFSAKNYPAAKSLFSSIINSPELSVEQTERARLRLAQIALSANNTTEAHKMLEFRSNDADHEGFRQFIKAAAFITEQNFADAYLLYSSEAVRSSSLVDKEIVDKALGLLASLLHR
jgi:glycosyltransferase involved in cell wall biosynthesis